MAAVESKTYDMVISHANPIASTELAERGSDAADQINSYQT